MVTIGIDAHKRSHTQVVCDGHGRELARRTTGTSSSHNFGLLTWAARFGTHRTWAVEDCRQSSGRSAQKGTPVPQSVL